MIDLLQVMGHEELVAFLWFAILLDVPRYLFALVVLFFVPIGKPLTPPLRRITGIVSCHNEEHSIAACVASMRANGVHRIVVINDGSTDRTHKVAAKLGVILIDLPQRIGKPKALNLALGWCHGELVLVADADTVFAPGSVAAAAAHLQPGVGGVGFRLIPSNIDVSLTTAYQGIEYAIIAAGRRLNAAFGLLSNVSGAAGLFRLEALNLVNGWDNEVAEDAALAMKLRAAGWQLGYAPEAVAYTVVPATLTALTLQRLRWDASIVTIWWRKHPPSRARTWSDLFTSLDVIVFGMIMPLALPIYFLWLWGRIGVASLMLLGAVMIALAVFDLVIILLAGVPWRLLPYWPFYLVTQTLLMKPLRVFALIAELVFSITAHDPYLPKSHRRTMS